MRSYLQSRSSWINSGIQNSNNRSSAIMLRIKLNKRCCLSFLYKSGLPSWVEAHELESGMISSKNFDAALQERLSQTLLPITKKTKGTSDYY
jgi:hypothetical protein